MLSDHQERKKTWATDFLENRSEIVFFGLVWFFWGLIWILWPKIHIYGNFGEKILCLIRIIAIFWLKYGLQWGMRSIQISGINKTTEHNFRKINRKSCFFAFKLCFFLESIWILWPKIHTYVNFWWKTTMSDLNKYSDFWPLFDQNMCMDGASDQPSLASPPPILDLHHSISRG